ncbi:hypothetical protein ACOZ4I_10330 [Haloarcula salina]|uniref:hypothetical protein n=1 Tax=Haloarcula salina TaxID=1429914 RepID=UPI003C6EB673
MADDFREALPALLLAVVVLSAGCSGLPATDRQTSTPKPTVENASYPSGWSQEGISDVSVALQTHRATVNGTSRKSRMSVTADDRNRTVVRTVDPDAGTASVQLIDTEFDTDVHVYYSAEGVFEYDRTTDELTRKPDQNWTAVRVASHEGVRRPLSNLELNATEVVIVEGTTGVRYTVTGIRTPDSVPANTASGHVIVAEDGFIAEYDITRSNDEFTRQTRYDVSAFGNATVARPAWMPEE